jgi:hypothetical protein
VEPRPGSNRVWRDVPRAERSRLIALVYRGRTPTDPRDAANAAAYAQWLLDRTPPRPLRITELLFAPVAVAVSVYLASAHPGGIILVALLAGFHGLSLYQRSRSSKRLVAAQQANAALAAALGAVPDIEFPAVDPERPSPWTIRPGFRLGLAAIVLAGSLLSLVAYTERPHDRRSQSVRAIDAACRREHQALQELRGDGLGEQAHLAQTLEIEERLMHDIEAAEPAAQRRMAVNRILGRQNDRIVALEDWSDATRVNDRSRMFAASRNLYDAQQRFLGQTWALGATGCRGT